jgi:hypothetical protein
MRMAIGEWMPARTTDGTLAPLSGRDLLLPEPRAKVLGYSIVPFHGTGPSGNRPFTYHVSLFTFHFCAPLISASPPG